MFWRILSILIGGLILVSLQYGLIDFLPFPFSSLNIILLTIFFLYFLSGKIDSVIFLGLWLGFVKDLFSPVFFGLNMIAIFVALWLTKSFFENFFTNRTLPSFLTLNIFFISTFHLIFIFLNVVADIKYSIGVTLSLREFLVSFLAETILNLIVLTILFILTNQFTQKFKTSFIFKRS